MNHSAIAVFAGLAFFCLLQAGYWLVRSRRRAREAQMMSRLGAPGGRRGQDVSLARTDEGGAISDLPAMRRLAAFLTRAGIQSSLGGFLGLSLALIGGGFLLASVLSASLTSGLVIATIIALFEYLYLSRRLSKRLQAIEAQLPEALEFMMFALRAGRSLEDSIRFAAGELVPPLSTELTRACQEYEMGRPIEQALTSLAQRLESCRAIGTFVESVLILKQTGGNILLILEKLIDSLRNQAAYEIKFRALTSEGRTSGYILALLPLIVVGLVMLIQPGYVGTLFLSTSGIVMAIVAGTLWLLGILWIRSLVRPKV